MLDELVGAGYLASSGPLAVTPSGRDAMDRIVTARKESLRTLLADWEPAAHRQLGELINELAGELLGDEADRKVPARA